MAEKKQTPGRLYIPMTLTLHTQTAVNVFKGKRHKGPIGLKAFDVLAKRQMQAAKSGDDMAQQCLDSILEGINTVQQSIQRHTQQLKIQTERLPHINLLPSQSPQPYEAKVLLETPYGVGISNLVVQLDVLGRSVKTLNISGMIDEGLYQQIVQDQKHRIRKAMGVVLTG